MSAFDLLMKKTPKRKRPLPFIDCPAGCGARLLEREINQHLDHCLNSEDTVTRPTESKQPSTKSPESVKATKTAETNPVRVQVVPYNKDGLESSRTSLSSMDSNGAAGAPDSPPVASTSLSNRVSQSPQHKEKPVTSSIQAGRDVFTQMMENSKQSFATLDSLTNACVTQSFHLGADNQVTLRISTLPINGVLLSSRWSAMVTVKDKCEQEAPPLSFEVHLSSEVTCDPVPRRWTRNHSRLSIPVLKSLLQKSIRRRRPLDSVRIAMELADKALDELLRRLPIIILEDSTLHDDLDFLTWTMMAKSKGFSPPTSMMTRIFRIIFEVASCPRKDFIIDGTDSFSATLTKIYNENESMEASKGQTLLWAMLVRAEYGGMKGDIKMLRQFAGLWQSRFSESSLPAQVSQVVKTPKPNHWREIPSALHAQANEHSQQVLNLLQPPVNYLSRENLCPEAIDFHCSSVIDYLMEDKAAVGLCCDLLLLSGSEIATSSASPNERVERLAKHCMWLYSAGVNRRLPLVQQASKNLDDKEDQYKHLWTELFQNRAEAYQRKYIDQRLAR